VATSTSVVRSARHIARSTAELSGEAGVKNLRNRERSDSPPTNHLIASQSAAVALRYWTASPERTVAGPGRWAGSLTLPASSN
jgi:hypothetical protein